MIEQTHKHPEWKRMLDEAAPVAEPGAFFSMQDLSVMAGLDVRSPRGRSQFQKFRKALLVTLNLWLENQRGAGYRVVQPHEHNACAHQQIKRARRRIKCGERIAAHTRVEQLTVEERKANADIICRLAKMEQTVRETQREVRKLVVEVERKRLPSPVLN